MEVTAHCWRGLVHRLLKSVDGSYVYKSGKVHKVPANEKEALTSGKLLYGIQETEMSTTLIWCKPYLALFQHSTRVLRDSQTEFASSINAWMDVVICWHPAAAHESACCYHLHSLCRYLTKPALETIRRIKLYSDSLARYGKSPYLYPLYGLGELPQGFAR